MVALVRKRLQTRIGAGNAGTDAELADIFAEVASHALECCRVGLTNVRPVLTTDAPVARSLLALMGEVIDELPADSDPRDVGLTRSVRAVLAKASSNMPKRSQSGAESVRVPAYHARGQLAPAV